MKEEEGIVLSEKHGVNPSITICLLCGKDIGIALFGKLKNDEEAPKKCCIGELCDDCKAKLTSNKEIIISDTTGRYVIVSEEWFTTEGLELVSKSRILLVAPEVFDKNVKYEDN